MKSEHRHKSVSSGRTMETRQSKVPKLSDLPPEDVIVEGSQLTVIPQVSLDAVNTVMAKADQKYEPIVASIPAVVSHGGMDDVEFTTDSVAREHGQASSTKPKLVDTPQYASNTQDVMTVYPDPTFFLKRTEETDRLRTSEALKELKKLPIDQVKSIGVKDVKLVFGDVSLTSYEQLLLKVADDYYMKLPAVIDNKLVFMFLHYYVKASTGPTPFHDEDCERTYAYVTSSKLNGFTMLVGKLAISPALLAEDYPWDVLSEEDCQLMISIALAELPILSGPLKKVYALVTKGPESIEPIHPLLQDSDYFSEYVIKLTRGGSLDYSAILKRIPSPPEPKTRKLTETEAVKKGVELKETRIATLEAVGKGKGKAPIKEVLESRKEKETSNRELMALDRSGKSGVTRDTSHFKAIVMLEKAMKIMFEVRNSRIIEMGKQVNLRLDRLEQNLTQLKGLIMKQDEAQTILMAKAAQDNLATRETINRTLLQPQALELQELVSSGQTKQPISSSNLDKIMFKLRNFSTSKDSVSLLVSEVKSLLISHNQVALAENVMEQTITNAAYRARLIYSLKRLLTNKCGLTSVS